MADIKALEGSNYWEFCAIVDNYLARVQAQTEAMEKMKRENNLTAGNGKKRKVKAGKK